MLYWRSFVSPQAFQNVHFGIKFIVSHSITNLVARWLPKIIRMASTQRLVNERKPRKRVLLSLETDKTRNSIAMLSTGRFVGCSLLFVRFLIWLEIKLLESISPGTIHATVDEYKNHVDCIRAVDHFEITKVLDCLSLGYCAKLQQNVKKCFGFDLHCAAEMFNFRSILFRIAFAFTQSIDIGIEQICSKQIIPFRFATSFVSLSSLAKTHNWHEIRSPIYVLGATRPD